jgi:hypothetical protein
MSVAGWLKCTGPGAACRTHFGSGTARIRIRNDFFRITTQSKAILKTNNLASLAGWLKCTGPGNSEFCQLFIHLGSRVARIRIRNDFFRIHKTV